MCSERDGQGSLQMSCTCDQRSPSAEKEKMTSILIVFKIHYEAQWGESIAICGSLPELGNWNPEKAVNLLYRQEESSNWFLSINLPTSMEFEYKYLVLGQKDDKKEVRKWESRSNRQCYLQAGLQHGPFNDVWDFVTLAEYRKSRPAVPSDPVTASMKKHILPPPVLRKEKLFLSDGKIDLQVMRDHFLSQGRLANVAANQVLQRAGDIMKREANILRVKAPAVVCGDIHGQFVDLLHLMEKAGPLASTQYVFLGDYVDRGPCSTEVLLYLFACKINYPESVWLLRGNHESVVVSSVYGFKNECLLKYGKQLLGEFLEIFEYLPIGAIISGEGEEKVEGGQRKGGLLCLHGGISDKFQSLKDLEELNRTCEPAESDLLCDILWSDPIDVDGVEEDIPSKSITPPEEEECPLFSPNLLRGCGVFFSEAAICQFLERNGLRALVRGHTVFEEGWHKHWESSLKDRQATVITVFSAPNYCDMQNKAAFLSVSSSLAYHLITFQ